MGLTDEAAIEWLKNNKDIYALLRNELRGNKEVVAEKIKSTKKSK